ncbi:MAG: sucrose-6-phosphate hydrolase [Vicinamibacterales bacterium]
MGKPYEAELACLGDTYRWGLHVGIESLVAAIRRAVRSPLISVGSGGSLSVAEFAAMLHRNLGGQPAFAQTPLDATTSAMNLRYASVLMTSAGGRNPDVLGSFDALAAREPASFTAVCLAAGSPLARRAARFPFVDFVELEPLVPRDGFLATNSLLALLVVLARAYAEACDIGVELPRDWAALLSSRDTASLDRKLRPAWTKKTLVVLHGPSTRVAAIDLESRFTEAALQDVWVSDYRNFAHGRHHWLAKHPTTTAVFALVTPEDEALASKTLSLIPKEIVTIREQVPWSGVAAGIAAIGRVIHVAASAGRARGIDPGRPGVPAFGRRIYHLRAFPKGSAVSAEQTAIERKTGFSLSELSAVGALNYWRAAYNEFISQVTTTVFAGVVVDYDGTLCGEADRYGSLQPEIAGELERLARAGVYVGIATGRGKSVRAALRAAIPETCWPQFVVGYYNGGDIRLLSEDNPDGRPVTGDSLRGIARALSSHRLLMRLATLELRPPQIKVEPKRRRDSDIVWSMVGHTVHSLGGGVGASILRSSHSIDILAPGVDKRAVVRRVSDLVPARENTIILCIGDRGRYPGNDYLLLNGPCSLSVDETSADPVSCWNIAPLGFRQASACLCYLRNLKVTAKGLRFAGAPGRRRRA